MCCCAYRHCFQNTQGIAFFVDSCDRARIQQVGGASLDPRMDPELYTLGLNPRP